MKRTKPSDCYFGKESSFQASAVKLIRHLTPPNTLVCHIPNGRNAGSVAMGGFWKAQGVISGMPDIMVFHPRRFIYREGVDLSTELRCGLALELKVWPNKPSEEQEAIHQTLSLAGWRVVVAYGLSEVENAVKQYFGK